MDLLPPGFDHVVISCRACRGVDVLALQRGVMTPARLSCMWPRCSECYSPDLEITLNAGVRGHDDAPRVRERNHVMAP
jgi:hypothetical protein